MLLLLLESEPGGAWAQQQPCTCAVQGYITAEHTAEALPGAAVEVQGKGMLTDAQGRYRIEGLCPGKAVVQVSFVGYHTYRRAITLASGQAAHADAVLLETTHDLDLVEVEGQRRPVQTAASSTSRLTEKDIQAGAGDPLAALLARQPGVNLLRTGPTVAKPVLRGLHSSRVLILNAGVRHEGQQWGSEHAPELDPMASGTLTLVRGAATVRYGPEALGGVIIAEPPKLRDSAGMAGGISLAGASNNSMGATSGWLGYAPKAVPGLAARVQGTLRRAGDSRSPNYVLSNTGLDEYNGSYQIGYRKRRWGVELDYTQFNSRLGIMLASGSGNATDLRAAIATDRPKEVYAFTYDIRNPYQRVAHELGTLKGYYQLSEKTRLEVQVARQFNDRKEYDRSLRYGIDNSTSKPALVFTLTTWSGEALLSHRFNQHLEGKLGISGYFGTKTGGFDVTSSRFLLRSLIPDYESRLLGSFAMLEGERGLYRYEIGGRVDYKRYDIQNGAWPGYGTQRAFVLPSVTAAVARMLGQHLTADATLSSSARPPSIAELYSRGVHQSAASVEVGTPTLSPERMHAAVLGLEWNGHHVHLKGSAYLHYFRSYINLIPKGEPALTVAGTFPVFAYTPQNALFSGIEGEASWNPVPALQIGATAALVRARDVDTHRYLQQIPSDRYKAYLGWEGQKPVLGFLKKPFARGELNWVRRQALPGNLVADSLDYAEAPKGYVLVGLSAGSSFRVGKRSLAVFSVEVQNLLNRRYRDYLDRFRYYADAPGRNVTLRLSVPFEILTP